jgi:small subunit ribosomal protein S9
MQPGDATDEISQKWAEFADEFKSRYFKTKFDWYKHTTLSAFVARDKKLQRDVDFHIDRENRADEKIEFMYNTLDTPSDRKYVRDLLSAEMHKKSNIQDIGEALDSIIREYQQLEQFSEPLQPKSLHEEYTTEDLYPHMTKQTSHMYIAPSYYEDRKAIQNIFDEQISESRKILAESVDIDDQKRDHSKETLNDQEKFEMQVYSTIKRDPYYKHYIYNCFAHRTDFLNAKKSGLALAIAADNYKNRVKFDPIEIPDVGNRQVSSGFIGKLNNGKAWGAGRRKTARAIAAVQPGSGKIIVNGKNFVDYFLIPQYRREIIRPISVAGYTSMIDVELWVKGGGVSGQWQACIPAISKAISRFDPGLREKMEEWRFINSDGRVRERKKYGKKRARKGRVYRRR